MFYRYKTGMLAWALFRITGLALVGYLAMHIIVISNLHHRDKFDQTMAFLGSWPFRLLEIGLFLVVLYHSLNGIRIFIVDFFNGSLYQAKLFWGLMAVGAILFALGTYPMLSHALYWKDVQQGKTSMGSADILVGESHTGTGMSPLPEQITGSADTTGSADILVGEPLTGTGMSPLPKQIMGSADILVGESKTGEAAHD